MQGYEDAIGRTFVLVEIERELAQLQAGKSVSHEEALKRLSKWLQ
jgi:hypothetical protein